MQKLLYHEFKMPRIDNRNKIGLLSRFKNGLKKYDVNILHHAAFVKRCKYNFIRNNE